MKRSLIIAVLLTVGFLVAPAEAGQDKIVICHATGSGKFVTLTLPYNAVFGKNSQSAHFNEQGTPNDGHEHDYLGPCIPPDTTTTTTTTTSEVTTSTSTIHSTTTSTTTSSTSTPSTVVVSTTAPESTSTSSPSRSTTTSITLDTCEDLGTCPETTTTTGPSTTVPTTLADGGSDAARMFAPWAFVMTLLGFAVSFAAKRPA